MLNFDKVEELFLNLIDEANKALTDSEVAEIQEYIDVGEYGLALSTAVAVYVEEQKIASARTLELVAQLSFEMSDDPKPMLDRLALTKAR
jgi:hypothetical protein